MRGAARVDQHGDEGPSLPRPFSRGGGGQREGSAGRLSCRSARRERFFSRSSGPEGSRKDRKERKDVDPAHPRAPVVSFKKERPLLKREVCLDHVFAVFAVFA